MTIPHPSEASGASASASATASAPRGASSTSARPVSSTDTETATGPRSFPSAASGASKENRTPFRVSPPTFAPGRARIVSLAKTSPPTRALSASRTAPSAAITDPSTCPETVTGPSKTTTSPVTTPLTVTRPEKTTTSPTRCPRGTATDPARTIWSSGSIADAPWARATPGEIRRANAETTKMRRRRMRRHPIGALPRVGTTG